MDANDPILDYETTRLRRVTELCPYGFQSDDVFEKIIAMTPSTTAVPMIPYM